MREYYSKEFEAKAGAFSYEQYVPGNEPHVPSNNDVSHLVDEVLQWRILATDVRRGGPHWRERLNEMVARLTMDEL